MSKFFQETVKLVVVICFTVGAFLTFKSIYKHNQNSTTNFESLDRKSEALRFYLLANEKLVNEKPQRIEMINLSKRFEKEAQTLKKLKISQDKNSNFYISIQLFTDENDIKAPLIAQVRFIDIKSGNTIKEESLNLE